MSKRTTSSKSLLEKLDEQVKKTENTSEKAASESASDVCSLGSTGSSVDLYQQMSNQLSAQDPLKLKLEDQTLQLTHKNAELTEKIAQYIQEAEELRKAP